MIELPDLPARLRALTDLDSTLLVEAAAGTGKTALLAGRVTVALARGVAPERIAAITFNEHAASELSARIHEFVTDLLAGSIPDCLQPAFPTRLSDGERSQLREGHRRIEELTVTTIHGFCQRVVHSYAVEADIDPGARMMDAPASDAAFRMIFQHWLRERLTTSRGRDDAIEVMSEDDPLGVEQRLWGLAEFRRRHRTAKPVHADLSQRLDVALEVTVQRFRDWLSRQPAESGTLNIAAELERLAQFYSGCLEQMPDFRRLWQLSKPPPLQCRSPTTLNLIAPRRKWAWQKVAGKDEGARLADEADAFFTAVNDSYRNLLGEIATAMVEILSDEIDVTLDRYDAFKRQAAVLDFDDLLHRARRLVCNHETVRQALGNRYQYILVDEFQDTDPIQAETLFRIAAVRVGARWQDSALRPGALFAVGDPKQAIYRFRGADIRSYTQAKNAIRVQWPENILRITANFRCVPAIVDYINAHFEAVFNADGQPEYVPLTSMRSATGHGLPCVAKVSVRPAENLADVIRESEAAAVADLCERLIGNLKIPGAGGLLVPLRPADIALLAPATRHLRIYERALEAKGLPFASSAGRALLHRQEVQDLLALARTLADANDTLAFGALLRGPLVGLTEEELLDITTSLPVRGGEPDAIPRFTIHTDPTHVTHPLAHETLTILRELRSRAWATTPSLLLAEAVERLAMRPILFAREGNERARAVVNIERFLELAREYDVLGLRRFVHDMTNEWASGLNERQEGRVDAEGAIEIVTMHSSKGLEWPVVILINSASAFRPQSEFVHRPDDDTLHWRLGEIEPPALTQALEADNRIWSSERQRVWYVACTRARELLVVPEIPASTRMNWSRVVDDMHVAVPELSLTHFPPVQQRRPESADENPQTAEVFAREAAVIRGVSRAITWRRPSEADPDLLHAEPCLVVDETEPPESPAPIGAGRLRGLLLHKLIEEVLTGEIADDAAALTGRAQALMQQLTNDRTQPPGASELADTVLRTLAIPDIAALRPRLLPEFQLYDLESSATALAPMMGRADAVAFEGNRPSVVVDWKSDIAPEPAIVALHAAQLRDYLRASGAARGALVYMTPGVVQWVE